MLAMQQVERGGVASHSRFPCGRSEISPLSPALLCQPVAPQACVHVSHADRGGGTFSHFSPGRSEISSVKLSSMLAMQAELGGSRSAFLPFRRGRSEVLLSYASRSHCKAVIHISRAGRGGSGGVFLRFHQVALKSFPYP